MVETTEIQMTTKILEVAQQLGFTATRAPATGRFLGRRRPRALKQRLLEQRRPWALKQRLLGRRRLWEMRAMRPDLVIENEGKSVVIEVKRRQVLPVGVEQVLDYVDALDAKGVICVPDAVLPNIARSVVRYANNTDIHICSISEVGDVLNHLLSSPDVDRSDR